MSLPLTDNLKNALLRSEVSPVFVLKFEGIDYYFSAIPIYTIARYDQDNLHYNQDDLYYDRPYQHPYNKDYIIGSDSTRSFGQQIEPDKAGGTSTTSMTFKIVDYLQEFSKYISPGFVLPEFLGINCDVYFTIQDGTSYPNDSIVVMYGIVEEVSAGPGYVRVTINHPQNLLRQDFLPPYSAELTSNLEFKSKVIQNNRYLARRPFENPVYIQFISGSSLSVSVTNTPLDYKIIATINSGVTTAHDIRKAILDNIQSEALVEVKSEGDDSLIQVAQPLTQLDDSTFLSVDSLDGLIIPNTDPTFKTYVKVNNEILKVTSVDTTNKKIYFDTSIQNRGNFNSVVGALGKEGDKVSSFYVLEGNAIELALKLMISGCGTITKTVNVWGKVPGIGLVKNAVYFPGLNVNITDGITVGDYVSLAGVFTNRVVEKIVDYEFDSYIIVSGPDIGNGEALKTITFKSKYDTLPIGSGIKPKFIDVSEFESILDTYRLDVASYRFYIEDSIDLKEFLESQIFFPSSLYMVPRKGRISVAITRPLSNDGNIFVLDSDVVINPGNVEITRSLNKYFYNSIKWYYNPDSLENSEYLDKEITVNAESVDRFKRGIIPLFIESKGLRPDLDAGDLIKRNTRRMIDRFKNAPEYLTVRVPLSKGIQIEIGDSVVFGDSQTQITDTTQGSRNFLPRIFQVINKEQSLTDVELSLLECNYGTNERYGVFAPSSLLASGSTSTELILKRSFGTKSNQLESDKWVNYIGHKIQIRDDNFTFSVTTTLIGIDDSGAKLIVNPGVTPPPENAIVEPAPYDGAQNDPEFVKWKAMHCFFNPTITVLAGISTTQFTVPVADQNKLLPKQPVRIHNDDFTVDSGDKDFIIDTVSGNLVTLKKPLPFTPTAGLFVELIGFQDGGKPYSWV